VPFAYLISKWVKGIDIRKVGSRNPGAANVIAQVGKGAGAVVTVLDMSKGLVPVLFARSLGLPLWAAGLAGVSAVVGHCWPVFLRFDGGEGMNTAMGALLALVPLEFFVVLSAGVVVGFLSGLLRLKGWFGSKVNFGASVGFPLLFGLLFLLRRPLPIVLTVVLLVAVLALRQVQVAGTHSRDF